MTEHFGPCGIGWGMDKPEYTLVPAGDELMVYCVVSLWYRDGETTATVYGVGGDKVLAKFRTGIASDDEAFKKAFTDALSNGMKHIGMSADVHMGRFEDSKYVQEARRDAGKRLAEWAAGGHATIPPGRDAVSPAAPAPLSEAETDALRADLNATAESKASQGSAEFKAWWKDLPRHERDLIRGMVRRYEAMAREADDARP